MKSFHLRFRTRALTIAAAVALFSLYPIASRAQSHWKEIFVLKNHPEAVNANFLSGYFLNRDYGFIANGPSGKAEPTKAFIFRTSDAGLSWSSPKSFGTFLERQDGEIRSILMQDSLIGWFTFQDDDLNASPFSQNGIFSTTNGGLTWSDLVDSGQYNDLAEPSPGHLVAGDALAFEDAQRGIQFGAQTVYPGVNSASWTVDGGATWYPFNSVYNLECWDAYCQQSTHTYFVYSETMARGLVSSDLGATWRDTKLNNNCDGVSNFTTGGIAGGGNAVYVQSTGCGLYRTTDAGITWVPVGGPSYYGDTRIMSPKKCNGAVVIAYDYGVAWMTTDGGDGKIPLPADTLTIQPTAFDTISSCDSTLTPILFANCGCTPADYHFDSARVVSDGRFGVVNNSLFPTAWNGFASRDTLFVKFNPNHISGVATGLVHLYGRIIRDSTITPFDSVISLHAYATAVGPDLETTLGSNSRVFNLGPVSICTGVDTVVHLRNDGCGSLTITAEDLAAAGFDVTQLSLPLTIPKDSTVTLQVHTLPTDTIPENGTITLHVAADSLTQLLTLQLEALGTWKTGNLVASPKLAQFDTASLCAGDSVYLTLVNTGCDSIEIDSSLFVQNNGFLGDSDFSISALPSEPLGAGDSAHCILYFHPQGLGVRSAWVTIYSHDLHGEEMVHTVQVQLVGTGASNILVSIPASLNLGTTPFCKLDTLSIAIDNMGCDTLHALNVVSGAGYSLLSGDSTIAPNANGNFRILFIPSLQKGPYAGLLQLHLLSALTGKTLDTSAALMVDVGDGPRALSTDTTMRDFGALYECESRDTTLFLTNPGCDTLTVSSAAFSNPAYASLTPFPIIIPPGDTAPVKVSLQGSTGSMDGTVTFSSDANSGPSTGAVPLRARPIPPAQLHLMLSPSQSSSSSQSVTFYVILTDDTGAAAAFLNEISFLLTHNDDLLSLLKAEGLTWSSGMATTTRRRVDTFAWSAPAAMHSPDTIGTLMFQVYLTDSSSTPLTLSNISFHVANGLPPDCIASIGDSGSGFTYLYQCGNHILQQFLRTGEVNTGEQNYPNPVDAATGFQTTIPFSTTGNGTATIRILNQDGVQILTDDESVTYSGKHFFYFTAKDLPAGTYYYQIQFPKGVVIVNRSMLLVK